MPWGTCVSGGPSGGVGGCSARFGAAGAGGACGGGVRGRPSSIFWLSFRFFSLPHADDTLAACKFSIRRLTLDLSPFGLLCSIKHDRFTWIGAHRYWQLRQGLPMLLDLHATWQQVPWHT